MVAAAKSLPPQTRSADPAGLLFAARVKSGMSQREAAERAGLTQQYWHALESGRRDAGISTWRRAFNGLDCDLALVPSPRRHLGEWRARRAMEGKWAARSVRRTDD